MHHCVCVQMDNECITKIRKGNPSANSLQHCLLEFSFMNSSQYSVRSAKSVRQMAFILVYIQSFAASGLLLVAALIVSMEKYLCSLL